MIHLMAARRTGARPQMDHYQRAVVLDGSARAATLPRRSGRHDDGAEVGRYCDHGFVSFIGAAFGGRGWFRHRCFDIKAAPGGGQQWIR